MKSKRKIPLRREIIRGLFNYLLLSFFSSAEDINIILTSLPGRILRFGLKGTAFPFTPFFPGFPISPGGPWKPPTPTTPVSP